MQSLADLRATVMNTGSASSLAVLDAAGSAAMTADESLVRALAAAGERYRDVQLSVRSARLHSPSGAALRGDTVEVEAVVDTSAHVVVDRSGSRTARDAVRGSPMVFTLHWGGRWRIASVESLS